MSGPYGFIAEFYQISNDLQPILLKLIFKTKAHADTKTGKDTRKKVEVNIPEWVRLIVSINV